LGFLEISFIELCLREDVMNLQTAHFAKQAGFKRESCTPILRFAHSR
jgi:hypothetical protein